jgi:hypothetical protein
MPLASVADLFRALMKSRSTEEVSDILKEIGDNPDMTLDQPFGPLKFTWHAFGDNASNLSTIGLASKSGRSLTERLTNAIDALLEDRFTPGVQPPPSSRAAGQQWFGRPISGPDDGLFNWKFADQGIDRRISVVMNSSGSESAPTIDVLDEGIGIAADRFRATILSLQGGNKINRRYLIGTFGQGGASTLKFCDYALIVSRHRDNPNVVSFTVVRELRLGEDYQVDAYGYLAVHDAAGVLTVPSLEIGPDPLPLYDGFEKARVPTMQKGTLVRHYAYRLSKLDKTLGSSPGNLYHYLHYSLFDPLLPFRIIDLRDPNATKNELVTGSRNRLMRLVKEGKDAEDAEDEPGTGSTVRHYRPMEFVVPFGAVEPCIGIEYWVVINYRKGKGKAKDELQIRPHSNELFIQTGHPIVGTLNGQNQGDLTAQLLKDIGLSMVSRHMVIHIDAAKADKQTRKKLFSTNRENFSDEQELASILQSLRRMLEEDENLYAIERELTERLTAREAAATNDLVKQQVTRLLLEAGFRVQEEGKTNEPGGNETTQTVRERKRGRYKVADPLPTLPFPQVTKFAIVSPKPKLEVRLNDAEMILVETDADAEYDRRERIQIRFDPDALEVSSKAPLRGGRMRWRVRPKMTSRAGDAGQIIVTLTKMDGTQLTDNTGYEVLPALEEKAKKVQGQVPPFDILPIDPTDHSEEWANTWPELGEDATSDELASVAYKPVQMGERVVVYYSTIFAPYAGELEKLKETSPAKAQLFTTNYEVWIGYHGILQFNAGESEDMDEKKLDQFEEDERVRVARMQVKQATQTADLQHRMVREKADA